MDPDSTASTKQILENGNYFNNDFLKELFESPPSTMDHTQSVAEHGEHPVQYSENHSGGNFENNESFTNGHNLVNGNKSLLDEMSSKNEALKKQIKELKDLNLLLQSQTANYESTLSQKLQDILHARSEMESLKQRAEFSEKEMVEDRAKLVQLEAQVYQLKELKISKDETDNIITELQKDLSHKAKIQQKLRNKIENVNLLLTEKNNDIRKVKQNNKKLWNLLTRFGRKLAKADLITNREMNCLMKDYDDDKLASGEIELDDQSEEITEQGDSESLRTAQNIEQSHDVNDSSLENPTPFLQPQPVIKTPSNNREGFRFGQSSKTLQVAPSFNRPRPVKSSNYFRKTYQEVLEDPQVSDDCMDVSVTELSTMRQQLCLDNGHFTPISPIPPTPPPKNNQSIPSQSKPSYTMDNPNVAASSQSHIFANNPSQHSQVDSKLGTKTEPCFNRRLAFAHQQSEGFDVAGESPNMNSTNTDSQNVLPSFNDSKSSIQRSSCRVLAKRQNDGCLKLQFNSPKAILFEVNYNTHDVTCTFPPITIDVPEEESASHNSVNVSNQPRASSTPFKIQKPVLVQNSVKNESEDSAPPVKKQRVSVKQEPFRSPPLTSKDGESSGFASYQKSCSSEGKSLNINTERRSFDNGTKESTFNTDDPYGIGGLFHHSPPAAFVFETEKPLNDGRTHRRRSVSVIADLDTVNKNMVRKEDNKSVVSSSCTSPFLFSEHDSNMLFEEDNLLELQPKELSPKKNSSASEAAKPSNPIDANVSFSNIEQDVSVTVPAQSIDNTRPFNIPIFGSGKMDLEQPGYTSSESDQCEDSSFDYKSLSKRMGPLNYSNGTLRRRRKKLGESSHVAPIRTKGRSLQSRTYARKAALDKSSESDTASKEQGTKEIHGKIESNKVVCGGSVEKEINGLHCFSESSVFKVPKRVSRVKQNNHDSPVSPVREENFIEEEAGLMNGIVTTSIGTHVTKCSNDIPSSDVETITPLSVGDIDMDCDGNQNFIQNRNVSGLLEESVLEMSKKTNKKFKSTGNIVNQNGMVSDPYGGQTTIKPKFMRKSSTDEVPSETEHEEKDMNNQIYKTKRKPKKFVNDLAPICPDELDGGSTSTIQGIIQKENTDGLKNEDENQVISKRRTRSTSQREIVSKKDDTNKSEYTFAKQGQKQTSCTDTENSESEHKSRNSVRRRRNSRIDGLRNQKSLECITSNHNRLDSNAEAQDELLIESSKQSICNDIIVKNNVSNGAETIKNVTALECKEVITAEIQSNGEEKEKDYFEANPEFQENAGSVNDTEEDRETDKNMPFSKESGSNSFPIEEENERDLENSTTHNTVQTSFLSNSYKKVRVKEEKNGGICDQENISVSSLKTTKSGKMDESSNISKLESVTITPTKASQRVTKEVLELGSDIQRPQTILSPGKKVIKKLSANSAETNSTLNLTSPLQIYKTQCTIIKLPNEQDSSTLKAANTNVETVSNSVENQNLQYVVNSDCTITSVMTDDDSATTKPNNKSSILTLTPVKTKTPCNSSPIKGEGQDFEIIDFTQMDAVYGIFETPVNPESNEMSITKSPNKLVEKEKKAKVQNSEVDTLFEENRNANKSGKEFEKNSSNFAYKNISHAPMSLSTDPVEILKENSFSAPLSSDTKDLTGTTDSLLKGPETILDADSPLVIDSKENVLSNLNVVEIEVQTSPKIIHRTRSKSFLVGNSTDTTSRPSRIVTSNCCVFEDSSNISEIDSDSPLVIAEEILESESHPVLEDTNKPKATPRKTRRKRSKTNFSRTKKTRKSSSVETETSNSSVEAVFQDLEKVKFTDQHSKIATHNLVRVLIDPNNSQDAQQLIFHIIQHLHQTKRNPMLTYLFSHDISTLLPITENCIVSALFQIALKGKPQFSKLLESTVLTLYNLVLGKEKQFSMYGLAALCRVLTEICKRRNNKNQPIKLCGELIKWEHQYAPYLIASIAGIWQELFQPVNDSDDEENIFFGAIARGVKDKPDTVSHVHWRQCQTVLKRVLTVKATEDRCIPKTVSLLVQRIRSKCVESIYDNEYLLTTPLVIYSRIRGWKWAKDVLMDTFIVPSIKKHTSLELNEIAFEFFINLYAEICYNFPLSEDPYGLPMMYYNTGNKETDFLHFTAAIALLKLTMWKCDYFSDEITEWMTKWSQHHKVLKIEYLFKRRMMADQEFCITDIIEDSYNKTLH